MRAADLRCSLPVRFSEKTEPAGVGFRSYRGRETREDAPERAVVVCSRGYGDRVELGSATLNISLRCCRSQYDFAPEMAIFLKRKSRDRDTE